MIRKSSKKLKMIRVDLELTSLSPLLKPLIVIIRLRIRMGPMLLKMIKSSQRRRNRSRSQLLLPLLNQIQHLLKVNQPRLQLQLLLQHLLHQLQKRSHLFNKSLKSPKSQPNLLQQLPKLQSPR